MKHEGKILDFIKDKFMIRKAEIICTMHGRGMGFYSNKAGMVCSQCIEEKIKATPVFDRKSHLIKISKIPIRYHKPLIENKITTQLNAYINDFQKNNWKHLFLTGPTGTGKTHAACWFGLQLVEQNISVYFGRASVILDNIKQAYSTNENYFYQLTNEFDVLILDDVDLLQTDHDKNKMSDLIRTRYEQLKPIVTTTNMSLPELSKVLGARTGSVLSENLEAISTKGMPDRRFGG